MGAIMTIRFSASVLAAAAVLLAASSSLPTLASEGLAPAQPVVSKRVSAAAPPSMRITRSAVWYKPARFAWSWSHNSNVMLGVAY